MERKLRLVLNVIAVWAPIRIDFMVILATIQQKFALNVQLYLVARH